MSESKSRYAIIQELTMRKNSLVNQLDELEETKQEMQLEIKKAGERLEEWKKTMPGKKTLIETQMKNIDNSLKAIQDISKETK